MVEEDQKCDINNIFVPEDRLGIKQELEDDCCTDNKAIICENTFNINDVDIKNYVKNGLTEKLEIPITDIKMESIESQSSRMNDNFAIKDEVDVADDVKIEFINRMLFCEHCRVYYEDYCTTCKMLIHILNRFALSNGDAKVQEELPHRILEIRNLFGQFGVFAMKVIPKDVNLGPFTGLGSPECRWKMKGGRFVVNDDKSNLLNWMQYVSPVGRVCQQNLVAFQRDGNLYYRSDRDIHVGEELVVHFGAEYENSLKKNIEMDFIPTAENDSEDVFACTVCCLGFSACADLIKHKTVCANEADEKFSIEELVQCPFCKIYLWQKEYSENHVAYCGEKNFRHCTNRDIASLNRSSSTMKEEKHQAEEHSARYYSKVRTKTRNVITKHFQATKHKHLEYKCISDGVKHPEKAYKCSECEYKTGYKSNLDRHIKIKHNNEKDYQCAECEYKACTKSYLEKHIKAKHIDDKKHECTECSYKTSYKSNLESHVRAKHVNEKDYKCTECEYKTSYKTALKTHVKAKHVCGKDYKCIECKYKTSNESNLEKHIRIRHINEKYQCTECEYKTSYRSYLEKHIKIKHVHEKDYKCPECDYQTSYKSYLEKHIQVKHIDDKDYKCRECEYKTTYKSNLKAHVRAKHTNEKKYRCTECEYRTSYKAILKTHIKVNHINGKDYKCTQCEYETNFKSTLKRHVKARHLNKEDYM